MFWVKTDWIRLWAVEAANQKGFTV